MGYLVARSWHARRGLAGANSDSDLPGGGVKRVPCEQSREYPYKLWLQFESDLAVVRPVQECRGACVCRSWAPPQQCLVAGGCRQASARATKIIITNCGASRAWTQVRAPAFEMPHLTISSGLAGAEPQHRSVQHPTRQDSKVVMYYMPSSLACVRRPHRLQPALGVRRREA